MFCSGERTGLWECVRRAKRAGAQRQHERRGRRGGGESQGRTPRAPTHTRSFLELYRPACFCTSQCDLTLRHGRAQGAGERPQMILRSVADLQLDGGDVSGDENENGWRRLESPHLPPVF